MEQCQILGNFKSIALLDDDGTVYILGHHVVQPLLVSTTKTAGSFSALSWFLFKKIYAACKNLMHQREAWPGTHPLNKLALCVQGISSKRTHSNL